MKKLSEPKEKWSNAWMRWAQQQLDVKRKEYNDGSSQIRASWGAYGEASPDVVAEALFLEIHHKVFSDQPAKSEVSRHIANVIAPMMMHYAHSREVAYYDWMTGSWKQHAKMYHEIKKKHSYFQAMYGDLWSKAAAAVEQRWLETKKRWKAESEERQARWKAQNEERKADARVRPVSAVQAPESEDQAGGGS